MLYSNSQSFPATDYITYSPVLVKFVQYASFLLIVRQTNRL